MHTERGICDIACVRGCNIACARGCDAACARGGCVRMRQSSELVSLLGVAS